MVGTQSSSSANPARGRRAILDLDAQKDTEQHKSTGGSSQESDDEKIPSENVVQIFYRTSDDPFRASYRPLVQLVAARMVLVFVEKNLMALLMVKDRSRFPRDTKFVAENYTTKKSKWMTALGFPEFMPKNEADYEDWVDKAAASCKKNDAPVRVFQDAWMAAAPSVTGDIIGEIKTPDTHEELVTAVAKELFKKSDYAQRLAFEMHKPKRSESTLLAKMKLVTVVARLYRVCQRSGNTLFQFLTDNL